jgi:xylulokinase
VADILGIEILLPKTTDASFGAALLAGVGIGVFSDALSAAVNCTEVLETALPDTRRKAYYDELFALYKQAQRGLSDVNHALSRLPTMPMSTVQDVC